MSRLRLRFTFAQANLVSRRKVSQAKRFLKHAGDDCRLGGAQAAVTTTATHSTTPTTPRTHNTTPIIVITRPTPPTTPMLVSHMEARMEVVPMGGARMDMEKDNALQFECSNAS